MTTHDTRRPIIGVMGSGRASQHDRLARELGQQLAAAGYVLLTGGGNGIMSAASQGMAEAGGLVIGILPSDGPNDPRYAGTYPNPYVHIPIYTGMSLARNAINIKSSDVVVALPGGPGTLSEIALTLNDGKHVIILNWPDLELPASCPTHLVHYAGTVADVLRLIGEML